MKKICFKNVESYDDIERTIKDALKYDVVCDDREAVEKWFKDAGIEGEIITRLVVSTFVNVWNDEMDGEEKLHVIVLEHYVDSGSEDYVYTYEIY